MADLTQSDDYAYWLKRQQDPAGAAKALAAAQAAANADSPSVAATIAGGIKTGLTDAFGAAPNVGLPSPSWGTTQYGGDYATAQQNQSMLYGSGDQNSNTDIATAQGLYNKQQAASTGSQVAGGQATAQGQQTAQSGLGTQQQAASNIGNWLQQGPGPSVAQAQLQQGNDTNVANMMAMAASGRGQGGGAAAQQSAAFQGANAGQQTNQQAAVLRAQEAQNWKQNQLQGMQAQAGIGSNITGAGQTQQNLGLNYNQLAANQQQNAGSTLQSGINSGQQNQQYFYNLGQQQLANQTQAATNEETARMNDQVQAQIANQNSFYQHQNSLGGMMGAAAGALSFL
jgi:hypothetical protein